MAVKCRWPGLVLVPGILMMSVTGPRAPALAASWPDGIWSSLRQSFGAAGPRGESVDALASFLRSEPETPLGVVHLAAHAGAEGHWTFLSRRGDTFTVGTPNEMKRVVATLAPEAGPKAQLTFYLSPSTVMDRAELLKELPQEASLALVWQGQSYPLFRTRDGGGDRLRAVVRPRLHLEIVERSLFSEALAQIEQPVDKRSIRVLSLEPGGPETLARAPKPDPVTGRLPADVIDPFRLPAALSALTGQTAVVSGRVNGEYLVFRPSNGQETTILAGDVIKSAARYGADLLLVQSSTPHQPGGRNWLWQRFEIDGLSKAMDHATFGDFLATLAGGREPAIVAVSRDGDTRIALTVNPPRANSGMGSLLQEVTAGITGSIAPGTVSLYLTKTDHRRELSRRLFPMVPSSWQAVYGIALLLGVLGLGVARRWWRRLWPGEKREDYAGRFGYLAAMGVRGAVFALMFLPLASVPAVLTTIVESLRGRAGGLQQPAG